MSALTMWVIYGHPTDRPDSVVARKWLCGLAEPVPTDHMIERKSHSSAAQVVIVNRRLNVIDIH